MHGRSRMTIDPRIATTPGRSASGFHRLGRHCLRKEHRHKRTGGVRLKYVWPLCQVFQRQAQAGLGSVDGFPSLCRRSFFAGPGRRGDTSDRLNCRTNFPVSKIFLERHSTAPLLFRHTSIHVLSYIVYCKGSVASAVLWFCLLILDTTKEERRFHRVFLCGVSA